MFWRQHLLSNFDDIFSCREELLTVHFRGRSAQCFMAGVLMRGCFCFPLVRQYASGSSFLPQVGSRTCCWNSLMLLEARSFCLCPDDIASFSILPICHCCARLLMAQVLRDLGDRRLVLTFPAEFVQALEEPFLGLLPRKKCS